MPRVPRRGQPGNASAPAKMNGVLGISKSGRVRQISTYTTKASVPKRATNSASACRSSNSGFREKISTETPTTANQIRFRCLNIRLKSHHSAPARHPGPSFRAKRSTVAESRWKCAIPIRIMRKNDRNCHFGRCKAPTPIRIHSVIQVASHLPVGVAQGDKLGGDFAADVHHLGAAAGEAAAGRDIHRRGNFSPGRG